MAEAKRYMYRGQELYVTGFRGLGFRTTRKSPDGNEESFRLSALPVRRTRRDAQKDLDEWAAARGLEEI